MTVRVPATITLSISRSTSGGSVGAGYTVAGPATWTFSGYQLATTTIGVAVNSTLTPCEWLLTAMTSQVVSGA